ncbi:hypothetical protein P872_20940 [Rhodonellum psychrophilum GCM71 = DSM 17998]|uniref:Uncharacterized protein n=1 Tax=Rhodonellum psychrophilum GCM71 = DSM 17998 TaxID=1123057 RepID=U5BYU8_9BACT|nr:hypothetical protein P872_20940 [Rhodonellum psychrophilum GCM71 = DSM 17998]
MHPVFHLDLALQENWTIAGTSRIADLVKSKKVFN